MRMAHTSSISRPGAYQLPDGIGLGGAVAGLGGGLALAMTGAVAATVSGYESSLSFTGIAGIVFGPGVLTQSGFIAVPVLLGALIHFLMAGLFGALFGIVLQRALRLTTQGNRI
ncbi:MAG TPA: hypothetical protein VLA19_31810 [Herpetosiphonaceae bacterium]|nr:hypothetical protein [Herpetosiphonaceae bacterium]